MASRPFLLLKPMPPLRTLVALCVTLTACRPGYRHKLSGELQQALAAGPADRKLRVLVDLRTQLDLAKLSDSLAQRHLGRAQGRWLVVTALTDVARESQSALRPLLEQLRRDGAVESYHGFVIVNRVVVTGTARAIKALARRPDVAAIDIESVPQATVLAASPTDPRGPPGAPWWAVRAVGADRAWRRRLTGRGVVVGIIDAGASAAHEQLRGNYRGGDDSWHDPTGQSAAPVDGAEGHGTAVLSAAVAQNVAGKRIGVAPGARWVACVGLPHGRYNNVAVTECADWMLTTAQPDVLINPWLLPAPGCGQQPRVDQHIGLGRREHPVGAFRDRDIIVPSVRQSHAGHPTRAGGDADALPGDVLRDRGAQHRGPVPLRAVHRRGALARRIVPGVVPTAVIPPQLFVRRRRAGIDDADDDATAGESASPGAVGAHGAHRPPGRARRAARIGRAGGQDGCLRHRFDVNRRHVGPPRQRLDRPRRAGHQQAVHDQEAVVGLDGAVPSQLLEQRPEGGLALAGDVAQRRDHEPAALGAAEVSLSEGVAQLCEVELRPQVDQHAELPIGGPGGEGLLQLAGQLVAIPRPASGEGRAQGDERPERRHRHG